MTRRAVLVVVACLIFTRATQAQDERVIPSDRVTSFGCVRAVPTRIPPSAGACDWTKVTPALAPKAEDELRIHHLNFGTGSCGVVQCPGANAPPMIVTAARPSSVATPWTGQARQDTSRTFSRTTGKAERGG